jgi:MerR family mercuric resistance operon transcriptional regulator
MLELLQDQGKNAMASESPAAGPWVAIGIVAARTGCAIDTIRFYEKSGILPAPRRQANGRRIYGPADIARIGFIHRARALGFSLEEVTGLLALADGDGQPCAEVMAAAIRHRADIRGRIADLARIESALGDLIDRCRSRSDPTCPLIEALFEAPGGG